MSIVDVAVLLPHLAGLQLDRVSLKGARVRIEAKTSLEAVRCPGCGRESARVHNRYPRHLADAGIGGRETTLGLTVRRLFCDQAGCGRGYRGTPRTLQRFLIQFRGINRAPAPPPVPAARHLTAWIMRPHHKLTDNDRIGLKHTRARCPDLDALTDLAHGFNHLVRDRRGHQLEEWIKQATACPFPEIHGFAAGLLNDFDAEFLRLTLRISGVGT